MVVTIEHHSLSEEVAEYLLTQLLVSDQYPCGTFIREEEVARLLNISRAPVREALRILDSQGLVKSIPRRGALVIEYSEEDVAELYDIRFALESHQKAIAAVNANAFANEIVPVEIETPEGKECPFCKQSIAVEATRCSFCTSQLEVVA